MEDKFLKKQRYRAQKLNLQFRNIKRYVDGYRVYDSATGALVGSVNGVDCNRVLTLSEVADFLDAVNSVKVVKVPVAKI